MIIFYPRDIGKWRDEYDFNQNNGKPNREFSTYRDFIQYMKDNRTQMDDSEFPFYIADTPWPYMKGKHSEDIFMVHQWTVQGWVSGHDV